MSQNSTAAVSIVVGGTPTPRFLSETVTFVVRGLPITTEGVALKGRGIRPDSVLLVPVWTPFLQVRKAERQCAPGDRRHPQAYLSVIAQKSEDNGQETCMWYPCLISKETMIINHIAKEYKPPMSIPTKKRGLKRPKQILLLPGQKD